MSLLAPHHRILKRRGQWEIKGEGRNKSSNVNVCVNSTDYGRGDWAQSEWEQGRDQGGGTGRGCRREGKSCNSISTENILKGCISVENYSLKFSNIVRDKRLDNEST